MNTFEIDNLGVRELTKKETLETNGGDGISVALAYIGFLCACSPAAPMYVGALAISSLIYECVKSSK